MKVIKHDDDGWEYELSQPEGICLRSLIRKFPLTPPAPLNVSRTEAGRKAREREKLLGESLAEHRNELKQKASSFLSGEKFKPVAGGCRLRLDPAERETLLQLLNDIRICAWHALGEPADIESLPPRASKPQLAWHTLMHFAGFFEFKLLDVDIDDQA